MQDAALTIGKFEGPISQSDNRDDLLFVHDVAGARCEGYYESSKRLLDPISMAQKLKDSLEVQKAIRRRAAELYWRSGALVGHDLDNWRQAEAEILRETGHLPRPAVVINLEGVVYTGEYDLAAADGYLPGEIGR